MFCSTDDSQNPTRNCSRFAECRRIGSGYRIRVQLRVHVAGINTEEPDSGIGKFRGEATTLAGGGSLLKGFAELKSGVPA